MLNRRRFLAGVSGGLALAATQRFASHGSASSSQRPSLIDAATTPTPAAAPTPANRKLFAPALQRDGAFPIVNLSKQSAFQGGAVMVTAQNVVSGHATVLGRDYLLASGPEGLAGIVGFGVVDPVGPTTLTVNVLDAAGFNFNYPFAMSVVRTDWTFDSITIPPPDPNATPAPGPTLVDEQPKLNAIYGGVSGRRWRQGWQIPIVLGGDITITSYFGEERSYNGGPRGGHHGGTDIGAPRGTPIHVTNDGIVVMAELTLNRGNCVVVDHGAGVFSCYGHMDVMESAVGKVVTRGDVIGHVGSTGLATGPHLHWEMTAGGVVVDGLRWLDGTQGFQ